ncbi:MAG: hypothetical protein WB507_04575 [Solirubrobacterales bacterium]
MSADPARPSKTERRADLPLLVGYHEARLADLLERVREGFDRYDSGGLDAFELDDLIHHYKRAARELWKFCGNVTGSRAHSLGRCTKTGRGSSGGSAATPSADAEARANENPIEADGYRPSRRAR